VSNLQPVSVALKFGFLGILYLFLLWVARSGLGDLRSAGSRGERMPAAPADGTGLHSASRPPGRGGSGEPRLVVERAPGHQAGMIYDIGDGAVLGRGESAEIRLDDPFASARHARVMAQAGIVVLEDLGSTNGTYLNEELLQGPAPLHQGDRVRIGDSEFSYEDD
jgi:hypothetical protein